MEHSHLLYGRIATYRVPIFHQFIDYILRYIVDVFIF